MSIHDMLNPDLINMINERAVPYGYEVTNLSFGNTFAMVTYRDQRDPSQAYTATVDLDSALDATPGILKDMANRRNNS